MHKKAKTLNFVSVNKHNLKVNRNLLVGNLEKSSTECQTLGVSQKHHQNYTYHTAEYIIHAHIFIATLRTHALVVKFVCINEIALSHV